MKKSGWRWTALMLIAGGLVGFGISFVWHDGLAAVASAQQGRRAALPTLESLPSEVAQLDGKDVDLQSIFEGIDTSSLAAVKTAIEKQDGVEFASTYKTMLESCYACHKASGRPYLRPMIPQTPAQSILTMDLTPRGHSEAAPSSCLLNSIRGPTGTRAVLTREQRAAGAAAHQSLVWQRSCWLGRPHAEVDLRDRGRRRLTRL